MNHTETMKREKSIIAVLLASLVLCAIVLSNLYISEHIQHDCTGEDCPVCAEIQQRESLIHQIGEGFASLMVVAALIGLVNSAPAVIRLFILRETLISIKVRLND